MLIFLSSIKSSYNNCSKNTSIT